MFGRRRRTRGTRGSHSTFGTGVGGAPAGATSEPLEARTLFAAMTFTVVPSLSMLKLSGEVAGVIDLEAQRSGSLQAAYQGTIVVDVADDGTIQFLGGSNVAAQSKGTYEPGNAPANYAGEGEAGGFLDVKVGEAAVRGFTFDLTSDPLTLATNGGFAPSALKLETTGGKLEYDLRVGGDGDVNLDNETVSNNGTTGATLTGSGENRTLTIPINVTLDYDNDAELGLRGTIVARVGEGGGNGGGGGVAEPNAATIGDGAARSVTFVEADGTTAVFSLRGGGTANLRFENATDQVDKKGAIVVQGTGVRLLTVDALGTSAASRLTIRGARGADGAVQIPALTADGPLNTLGGAGVNLTGAVTINGPVAKVAAANLIGATVTADSIGRLAVSGNVSGSTITLDAPFNAGGLPAAGRVTVGGLMSGSKLSAAGGIGAVTAGGLVDSDIVSGTPAGTARFPATTDLPTQGGIAKLTTRSFDGSVVVARTLGNVKLGVVTTDNAGGAFGLAADSLANLQANNNAGQRLRLVRIEDPTGLAAALAAQGFATGDFEVRLA